MFVATFNAMDWTLAFFDLLASKTRERLKVSDSSKNQYKKKRKCCFSSGDLAKVDFFPLSFSVN